MPDGSLAASRTVSVRPVERVHDGFIKLDLYDVDEQAGERKAHYRREVHHHGHGAAVLPFDPVARTCLLARQFRVPPYIVTGNGVLVEAAAGMIDADDRGAEAAAIREAQEELGVTIEALEWVADVFTSPGVVTERIVCFLATYRSGGIGTHGGHDPDEMIEILEWPLARLEEARAGGRLRDAKTLILAQALRLKHPSLFG